MKYYQDKIDSVQIILHGLKKQSLEMLYGKLVAFIAGIALFYFFYGNYSWTFAIILLLAIFSYILCFVRDERLKRRIGFYRRMRQICLDEQSALEGNFSAFSDGERYINPHHEYTYDLDIFGRNSLFQRINRTITEEGSDCLAAKFQNIPQNKTVILEDQEALHELSDKMDFNLNFLSSGPITCRFDKIDKTILQPFRFFRTRLYGYVVYPILALTGLSVLLLPFFSWAGILLGTMYIIQILLTISQLKPTNLSIRQIEKLNKEIRDYLSLLQCMKESSFESKKLCRLKASLFEGEDDCMEALKQLKSIVSLFDQRNGMSYMLFNGFILSDVRAVSKYGTWMKRYGDSLSRWTRIIAEWDASVSLAIYCYNHPENVMPEMLADDSSELLVARDFYHPFLQKGKAVANDFILSQKNIYIITGANMAGKSTFLRTIGVNYLLAVNGVTVCARLFQFSIVSLFSSMRTSDDLSENISYFNAELLRLEQLINFCKNKEHTLIILDEILKGTNSKDKLQGSVLFLEKIQSLPVTVIVATHDLELAKMGEQNDICHNYSFEIELGKEIKYTYKIREGVARNLNATFLLKDLLEKI